MSEQTKTWESMTPHDRDAWGAEHVMGIPPQRLAVCRPSYSTDPTAGCEILKKVRETWGSEKWDSFLTHVMEISGCSAVDATNGFSTLSKVLLSKDILCGLFLHAAYLTLNEEDGA